MIDDREWYMLDGGARYWRLFTDRILPWLVLAFIVFMLYLLMSTLLELAFDLSEPLSKGLKEMGL